MNATNKPLTVFCALLLCVLPAAASSSDKIAELEEKENQVEREIREIDNLLEVLRESQPSRGNADLAAARRDLAEAEAAEAKVHSEAGLDAPHAALNAARKKRADAAMDIIMASPRGKAMAQRLAELEKQLDAMSSRSEQLSDDELRKYVEMRVEAEHLGRSLYYLRRAVWKRAEVLPHYRKADAAYKAYGRARGKSKEFKEAGNQVKAARKQLERVRGALSLDSKFARELLDRREKLVARRDELKQQVNAARKALLDGARTVTIQVEMPPKRGKPQKPRRVSFWMPPDCENIRGVIIASTQVTKFASHPRILAVAAEQCLATMVMPHMSFDGDESWQRLDATLNELAEKTGHPELRGAPVLTAGLSASVLATRNFAYSNPDRVFGTVQIAGGNMHHKIVDPHETLAGVPFIAMNGEFEWAGPEGGIQPEYGRQTQWVMIREQLLRRRQADPQHLMSLLVVPGGDHGHWDVPIAALFVEKAAVYRIPREKRDGSTPARCVTVKAEDGWLTDADLDHPTHQPAPYNKYSGDKTQAFWHFDEEMARAMYDYHKDRFILPDPTKQHPVPDTWPKNRGWAGFN